MKVLALLLLSLNFAIGGGGRTESESRTRHNSSTHLLATNKPQFLRPENPPKYFAIDIDGTLFSENEEALENNIKAIIEAKKRGYTPFFCTGKSRGSALKLMGDDFVERTGYNGYPGVYRNGAFIYGDNDALHMNILSRHFLSDIIGFLPNDSLNRVIFFHRDDSYSLVDTDPKIKDILKAKGFPDTQVKTLDEILDFKIRKMIISSDVSELSKLRENLGFNAFGLRDNLYEILPLDLNKALGIKQLMEHYGIPPEECAFIGNGDNDIEAMELSSLSFAVGNAPDYVKKHAKWVLEETCDEGAVAKALGLVYGFTIE
ncbi:haloacid dehalogenase-like hydrolase family member protein [Theileria equi strain WA]|uniref:Haloacid dehalogenase-like hydrolase family member protein n=1 Tax=Theileria equi strain WA TaxID=1537102 RepID=L1LEZ8_THEEQ|nr:haloacid dehalogenase-like hydrolase family member protein [Theileria equi strain WA]EKX73926.1 haloacid dehalogenase-like hydrolase family member protein [Theileria equi strain WA]|eukprot:XP_004833378.1 haloacid dehalogenase-like hydrolase family member protein [Theileria equi strain WA]